MAVETMYGVKWCVQQVVRLLQVNDDNITLAGSPLEGERVLQALNRYYTLLTQKAMEQDRILPDFMGYVNCEAVDGLLDIKWSPLRGERIGVQRRRNAEDLVPNPQCAQLFAQFVNRKAGPTNLLLDQFDIYNDGSIRVNQRQGRSYWRLWYMRDPQPLISGNVGTGSSATTLVVSSTTDYSAQLSTVPNAYMDEYILITGGTGLGSIVRVSAWDPTTLTFTVGNTKDAESSAWLATPTNTSKWSLLPWFPTKWLYTIIYRTLLDFPQFNNSQSFLAQAVEWEDRFEQAMYNRDRATQEQWGVLESESDLTGAYSAYGFYGWGAGGAFQG